MLRFTKESDLERINRLKKNILYGYIENESSEELLVSEADLEFLVEKAETQVHFETESSNKPVSVQNNHNDIQPIDTPMFHKRNDDPF